MRFFSVPFVTSRALPLLAVLLGCFALSTSAALADEQGWVLTQRSEVIGDQYVYVAPSGVKIVNPKIGYNIVLCAPDWNVCMYNDKTKTYYSVTYGQWMAEIRKTMGNRSNELRSGTWRKSAGSSICGLRASTYTMQAAGAHHLRNATCWVSDDIAVPRQITEMLAQSYGLPDNKAYPLKLNTVTNTGKLVVQLDTYNSQSCAIPSSYFYLPQGYTRVNSKEEVMVDDDTKQILRDLANDGPSPSAASSAPRQQQIYQQPTMSQYSQPQAQAQQTQTQQAAAPATPGVIQLPNGQTLDREKMRRIIEAIKSGGKNTGAAPAQTPTQTPAQTPPQTPTRLAP